MTDPLDALRDPDPREAPDPDFAAALRARLEEALGRPLPLRHGRPVELRPADALDDVLQSAFDEAEEALMNTPIPIQEFTPYLSVPDGRRAIAFYTEAFGAELVDEPVIMPDGKLGHATLRIGTTRLFLAEEFPEMNLRAPSSLGGVSVTLHLSFASDDDVDAVAERAVAAGAMLERAVVPGPYGRAGVVVDPAGHRWFLLAEPTS
ncbi:VOC family protein [Cryptosporangium minutisporangium]|uniref:VOC domain-containing protein n=1 Tax=Cryptosporangium minutisporangium TaxID=113569 RepID=A0ABP6SVX0_9ACTN